MASRNRGVRVRRRSRLVNSQQMDALDVNHLNELLEQDIEIRQVRRLQLQPQQNLQ